MSSRFVFVMYDWPEDMEINARDELVIICADLIGIQVNEVIFVDYEKLKERKKRTKNSDIAEALKNFHGKGNLTIIQKDAAGYGDTVKTIVYDTIRSKSILSFGGRYRKNEPEYSELVEKISNFISPRYGFLFVGQGESVDYLPQFISVSGSDLSSDWIASLRSMIMRDGAHQRGMLADVFCLNILNVAHLERMCGDRKFVDLVIDDHLGTIEKHRNIYLWKVDQNRIGYIKNVLNEHGMIYITGDILKNQSNL